MAQGETRVDSRPAAWGRGPARARMQLSTLGSTGQSLTRRRRRHRSHGRSCKNRACGDGEGMSQSLSQRGAMAEPSHASRQATFCHSSVCKTKQHQQGVLTLAKVWLKRETKVKLTRRRRRRPGCRTSRSRPGSHHRHRHSCSMPRQLGGAGQDEQLVCAALLAWQPVAPNCFALHN